MIQSQSRDIELKFLLDLLFVGSTESDIDRIRRNCENRTVVNETSLAQLGNRLGFIKFNQELV